jgi:tetratricopeptide (TPR) repeat protein
VFKKIKVIFLVVFMVSALFSALPISAQDNNTYQEKRAKAFDLVKQNKFTEAQPVFEELAKAKPDDAAVQYYAGYLTFVNAQNVKDAELRKREGLKARDYLSRAQQLGVNNANLRNMFVGIAPDGTIDQIKFSNIVEADKALHAGEEAFAKGDFKKALGAYAKALELAPNLYEAALYTGDIYYKSNEPAKAGEWFAKAIAIDPNHETAYRYWGDSLAKEGKNREARDKFIDAFVAEPYNSFARAGLINWAKANGVTLAHPPIKIPTSVSSGNGNTNITIDPSMFDKNKKDGSSAWFYYGITRAAWTVPGANGKLSERFVKAYPNETRYRHSLAEETDALRMVLSFLDKDIKDKKVENLEPSLANLKRLNDAGLLEAYILMAKLDNGLVQDYKSYRQNNRDKLRRYMVEYVMNGGGK